MKTTKECKNVVSIVGRAISTFEFDHDCKGTNLYSFMIGIARKTGFIDKLVVVATKESLGLDDLIITPGKKYRIFGEYRAYIDEETGKHRYFIFAKKIFEADECEQERNFVKLEGYVVKTIPVRETPLGKKILDVVLALNRSGGKTSYIPCIVWFPTEDTVKKFEIGNKVSVIGKIQSRDYLKKYEDGSSEFKVAYEVSVNDKAVRLIAEGILDKSEEAV